MKEKDECLSTLVGRLVTVNVSCEAWEKDVGRRGLPHRCDRVYVGEQVGKSRRGPWPSNFREPCRLRPDNGETGMGGPT